VSVIESTAGPETPWVWSMVIKPRTVCIGSKEGNDPTHGEYAQGRAELSADATEMVRDPRTTR
jgi:hypothetical protein